MPQFTWVEDNESRSASIVRLGKKATSSYVKSWKIFGSRDDTAVHADVNATIAAGLTSWQYPGQPNNKLVVDSYTLDYLGDDAWQLKVTYIKEGGEGDETEPLKRTRSFDTSGGTIHITQAIAEGGDNGEKKYPEESPPLGGIIGLDLDAGVQGVDIVSPSFKWTETYDVPSAYVTNEYIRAVGKLTGTVNDAEFRGFPAGEVLFMGATGSHEWNEEKGDGPWTLTFNFVQSPNAGDGETLPAIEVGAITDIQKKGHEYLWVMYEPTVEGGNLIRQPMFVYVNKVYRNGDFSQLGLGTA